VLVELSMVEQRYLAVREVLDTGASVTDVATRYGVVVAPFIAGWSATSMRGCRLLPIAAAGPIAALTRSIPRWRR
jgi:transposase-like protein